MRILQLTHLYRMDIPIPIIWMSPFSFLGTSDKSIFSFLFHFSMKIMSANRIAPDGIPRFAVSHQELFCLPMSHIKDARLICVYFTWSCFKIKCVGWRVLGRGGWG